MLLGPGGGKEMVATFCSTVDSLLIRFNSYFILGACRGYLGQVQRDDACT